MEEALMPLLAQKKKKVHREMSLTRYLLYCFRSMIGIKQPAILRRYKRKTYKWGS